MDDLTGKKQECMQDLKKKQKQIVNIFYRKVFPILTFVKVLFKSISSKGQVAKVSILLIVAP